MKKCLESNIETYTFLFSSIHFNITLVEKPHFSLVLRSTLTVAAFCTTCVSEESRLQSSPVLKIQNVNFDLTFHISKFKRNIAYLGMSKNLFAVDIRYFILRI
jgi:hypothetical protein